MPNPISKISITFLFQNQVPKIFAMRPLHVFSRTASPFCAARGLLTIEKSRPFEKQVYIMANYDEQTTLVIINFMKGSGCFQTFHDLSLGTS